MPTVATNRPASGGPNRFASCIVDSTSAFAGAIASSSTVRGTSDRNAGMRIASTMPNAMPMSAELPQLDRRAEDEQRDRGAEARPDQVRGEKQRARREPIREGSADQQRHRPRDLGRE